MAVVPTEHRPLVGRVRPRSTAAAARFGVAPLGTVGGTGRWRARARLALVLALGFAGVVHLSLGPEHLAESTLIGGGMMAGGAAQLLLAAAVASRITPRLVTIGVGAVSIAFLAGWLIAVTVGLPVEGHAHPATTTMGPHGVGGHVESVSFVGAVTAVAELVAIGLVRLLPRTGDRA